MTEEGGDPRLQLAYEAACRAVEGQERSLDEMRARAGATLGSVVIATAFFGSVAIRDVRFGPYQWAATGLFVASAMANLAVLWPRSNWVFRPTPRHLLTEYVYSESPLSIEEIQRQLTVHIGDDMDCNAERMKWLWRYFVSGLVLLVAEVAVWLVAVAHG